jgi:hypothetical protein
VKLDLAAIAWVPGGNDPGPADEDHLSAERRAERRSWRKLMGERRLREMCDWLTDGPRFVDVLALLYIERGEVLNGGWSLAESKSLVVAKRFARPGEKDCFRADLSRRNPRLTPKQLDALTPLAFGSALIGAAESAYEVAAGGPWSLAARWCPAKPTRKVSARRAFVEHMAEAWAQAKLKWAL